MNKVLLTPIMAQNLLNRNISNNRSLCLKTANFYANELIKGNWIDYHPQPIIIDNEGNLLDGQHRCKAVVLSGISVNVFMAESFLSAMATIDTGKKRTPSDACKISNIKNSTIVSALISMENAYEKTQKFRNAEGKYKISNIDIINIYYENKEHYDYCVNLSQNFYRKSMLLPKSLYATFLSILIKKGESDFIIPFFEQLTSGKEVMSESINLLRNRLIKELCSLKKTPIYVIHALIIKSYNAAKSGKEIKTLVFNPLTDKYPEL